jgi:hypothetical protein
VLPFGPAFGNTTENDGRTVDAVTGAWQKQKSGYFLEHSMWKTCGRLMPKLSGSAPVLVVAILLDSCKTDTGVGLSGRGP